MCELNVSLYTLEVVPYIVSASKVRLLSLIFCSFHRGAHIPGSLLSPCNSPFLFISLLLEARRKGEQKKAMRPQAFHPEARKEYEAPECSFIYLFRYQWISASAVLGAGVQDGIKHDPALTDFSFNLVGIQGILLLSTHFCIS